MVIVEGEAGIGKTRLVGELLSSAALAGRRLLAGHCHRLREPFPLGPVVEALRALAGDPPDARLSAVVGALRPLIPELAVHLPEAPELFDDARAERHRVFRGVLELLGALGETVLVLEDLHWADAGTLELLEFLVSQPPADLCVVVSYRREEIAPGSPLLGLASRAPGGSFKGIAALGALTAEEVGRLAASVVGSGRASEELGRFVYAQTSGNPFAAEQLLRLLEDRGHLFLPPVQSDGRKALALEVPPALSDAVLERVGLLGADAQLVVEAAAVLERGSCEEIIGRVAGLAPARTRGALCRSLGTAILRETGEGVYGFCHVLARRAVYRAIPPPRRRALHLRAARALEQAPEPRPLAQISHHYREAGHLRRWLRYAERAADAAYAIGEDQDAARILAEALSSPDVPRAARVRMAIKLGRAALSGRVPEPAISIMQHALQHGSISAGLRGELRLSLSLLLISTGEGDLAYPELERAAGELRRRPELCAVTMAKLAWWSTSADLSDPHSWFNRSLETAVRLDDAVVRTEVLAARALALLRLADHAAWRAIERVPRDARSVEHRLRLVRIWTHLSGASFGLGHYWRAASFLEHAERLRSGLDLEHPRFSAGLATVKAQLDWSTGRWGGLEERARELIRVSPAARRWSGVGELIIARLQLARGALEDAERGFSSLLESFGGVSHFGLGVLAGSGLATIHLARAEPEAAREVLGPGLRSITDWTCRAADSYLPVAVDVLLACHAELAAAELVRRFARELRGQDAPGARAALAACRGALAEADGRVGEAAGHYGRAERLWRTLPSPYLAAQAGERRGRCLLASGNRGGAGPLLEALESFEGLPAARDAARVKAQLRGHGVALPSPWRGGPRGYGQALSPRELEVARLVCAGKHQSRDRADAVPLDPHGRQARRGHAEKAERRLPARARAGLEDAGPRPRSGSSYP